MDKEVMYIIQGVKNNSYQWKNLEYSISEKNARAIYNHFNKELFQKIRLIKRTVEIMEDSENG